MLKSAALVFPSLLCCMLLVAAISSVVVFLYHHYYLRPHEMIVVDFRALSEAKLSQMVEDSRNGHYRGSRAAPGVSRGSRFQSEYKPHLTSGRPSEY